MYLVTESLSAAAGLALNIVCYSQWGLTGLGISYVLWYAIYTVIVTVVYCKHFGLKLSRGCLVSIAVTLLVAALMVWLMECGWWLVAGGLTLVVVCLALLMVRKMWKRH